MGGFHLWILRVAEFGPFWGVFSIWLGFSIYQGLFYGLATALSQKLKKKGISLIISLPLTWTLSEYIRHLGIFGNSSGALGYSLTEYPLLVIIAQKTSIWGLSFLIVIINSLIYLSMKKKKKRILSTVIIIIIIWGIYGNHLINRTSNNFPMSVAIIQGNHTQEEKKKSINWRKIQKKYIALTEQVKTKKQTLIIWPETITPYLNLKHKAFKKDLEKWSRNNPHQTILFGTPIRHNKSFYNAVAGIEKGEFLDTLYKKERLMPFGEYFPGKKILLKLGLKNILDGAVYEKGTNKTKLKIQDTKVIRTGICLEAIYPNHFNKEKSDIITIHANNAWFFDSSTSKKLLQMSQLRAIETKTPVLHAANTGVSAIIDCIGTIVKKTNPNERKILLIH